MPDIQVVRPRVLKNRALAVLSNNDNEVSALDSAFDLAVWIVGPNLTKVPRTSTQRNLRAQSAKARVESSKPE